MFNAGKNITQEIDGEKYVKPDIKSTYINPTVEMQEKPELQKNSELY